MTLRRISVSGGYNVGDANQSDRVDPGETWTFTCTTTIEEDTLNTAEIVAQPVDAEGTDIGGPLTRTA